MNAAILRGLRPIKPTIAEAEMERELEKAGCPVCSRIVEEERAYFFWLFHENYSGPAFQDRFNRSLGFCRRHAAAVLRREELNSELTFIYLPLARQTRAQVDALRQSHSNAGSLQRLGECPACESNGFSIAFATGFLASLLHRERDPFPYGKAGVLCLPHLRAIAPRLKPAILKKLVTTQGMEMIGAWASMDPSRTASGNGRGNDGNGDMVASALELLAGGNRNPPTLYPPAAAGPTGPRDPARELAESLELPDECPICRETIRAWQEWTAWLEQAVSHERDLDDVLPLCPEHLWAVVDRGPDELARTAVLNAFRQEHTLVQRSFKSLPAADGPSTRWQRLRGSGKTAQRLAARSRQVLNALAPCPICRRLETAESRAVTLLGALLREGRHVSALERGHGLCVPHFRRALAACDPPEQELLARLESSKLAVLEWELEETQRRRAWSCRPEARGAEQKAWMRALRRFSTIGGIQ